MPMQRPDSAPPPPDAFGGTVHLELPEHLPDTDDFDEEGPQFLEVLEGPEQYCGEVFELAEREITINFVDPLKEQDVKTLLDATADLTAPSIQRWRQLQAPQKCEDCIVLTGCGGGCRARALAMGQGLDGPDPWCCAEAQ